MRSGFFCHNATLIGEVVAQGAASGEFEVADLQTTSMCTCTAMMRFFHPQMIAQCATKPGPSIDQMIDFILASLASRAKGTGELILRHREECSVGEASDERQ